MTKLKKQKPRLGTPRPSDQLDKCLLSQRRDSKSKLIDRIAGVKVSGRVGIRYLQFFATRVRSLLSIGRFVGPITGHPVSAALITTAIVAIAATIRLAYRNPAPTVLRNMESAMLLGDWHGIISLADSLHSQGDGRLSSQDKGIPIQGSLVLTQVAIYEAIAHLYRGNFNTAERNRLNVEHMIRDLEPTQPAVAAYDFLTGLRYLAIGQSSLACEELEGLVARLVPSDGVSAQCPDPATASIYYQSCYELAVLSQRQGTNEKAKAIRQRLTRCGFDDDPWLQTCGLLLDAILEYEADRYDDCLERLSALPISEGRFTYQKSLVAKKYMYIYLCLTSLNRDAVRLADTIAECGAEVTGRSDAFACARKQAEAAKDSWRLYVLLVNEILRCTRQGRVEDAAAHIQRLNDLTSLGLPLVGKYLATELEAARLCKERELDLTRARNMARSVAEQCPYLDNIEMRRRCHNIAAEFFFISQDEEACKDQCESARERKLMEGESCRLFLCPTDILSR